MSCEPPPVLGMDGPGSVGRSTSDRGWTGACPAPIRERANVLLGHGSGGRLTAELIERHLLPALSNPALDELDDQAVLELGEGRIAFTTDSYVVTPLFFPGGDIGELAVNGTINDLAVGGARPIALSLGLILEEGLPFSELDRVIRSVREAARRAGAPVVTGDTKVVGRGSADRLFINTSGVGVIPPGRALGARRIQPGDAVLISGTVADHGLTILAEREDLGLRGQLESDTAPLHGLVEALLEACPDVHAMRDPTRGGVAAVLVELASRRGLGIELEESAVPVSEAVRGACELLGLDPLLVANEGKLMAFLPRGSAERALERMHAHPLGRRAALIGVVTAEHPGLVRVSTSIGGHRALELPLAEQLPRIC